MDRRMLTLDLILFELMESSLELEEYLSIWLFLVIAFDDDGESGLRLC